MSMGVRALYCMQICARKGALVTALLRPNSLTSRAKKNRTLELRENRRTRRYPLKPAKNAIVFQSADSIAVLLLLLLLLLVLLLKS